MLIIGPSQNVKGSLNTKMLVVSYDYTGEIIVKTAPIAKVSPAIFSLGPGDAQEITVEAQGFGEYTVIAEDDTQTQFSNTVSFQPKYQHNNTVSAVDLKAEIIDTIVRIDIKPPFNYTTHDEEGYFDVNQDRFFTLTYDGWQEGEIFGTVIATYRLIIGYLEGENYKKNPPWANDMQLIKNALYARDWPQGVLGIQVISNNVMTTKDLTVFEVQVDATIKIKN